MPNNTTTTAMNNTTTTATLPMVLSGHHFPFVLDERQWRVGYVVVGWASC
jgi:hypothetical protein